MKADICHLILKTDRIRGQLIRRTTSYHFTTHTQQATDWSWCKWLRHYFSIEYWHQKMLSQYTISKYRLI